jgi:hypothetical protein
MMMSVYCVKTTALSSMNKQVVMIGRQLATTAVRREMIVNRASGKVLSNWICINPPTLNN